MMDKDISCDNDDVGAKLSLIFNNRLAMHCKAAVAMMYKDIRYGNDDVGAKLSLMSLNDAS